MSGIFILAPVLVMAPAVLTATTACAAAMGFTMLSGQLDDLQHLMQDDVAGVVQFDVAEAKGMLQIINEQGPIVLRRGDATIVLRSGKGRVQMMVEGSAGQTNEELETLGRSVLGGISQQYAYHMVMSDLKSRGFDKVEEEQDEDGTIRLRLRRWD